MRLYRKLSNHTKHMAISTTAPTRYQVALTRGSEVLHVYGYTARKSKQGILAMVGDNVRSLVTDEEWDEMDNFTLKYTKAWGFQLASNLYIRFTGVTERQVFN